MMNKLLGTLLLCFLFLTSCGGDEADDLSLIGTAWTEVSSLSQGCDDESENGTQTCTDCETITFNADGTFTIEGEEQDGDVTYEVSGSQITITFSEQGGTFISTVQYAIVGNTLTITVEDDFDGCTYIITYTGS